MGIASPVWLRAIDPAAVRIAAIVNRSQAVTMDFNASRSAEHTSSASETALNMTTASSATKGAR
jgi:NADH-quinone oxidoreductase subunit M